MSSADTKKLARPTKGRPRDSEVDDRVLGATLDLLAEVGHSGLTIRAVAERAGVGNGSIYRRWSTKDELVLAAMRALQGASTEQEAGPPSDVVRSFLHRLRHALTGPHAGLVPAFVLAMRDDRRYAEIARDVLMRADRDAVRDELVRRSGGRLDGDTALLLADLGPSLLFTRVLVMEEQPTEEVVDELGRFVDILVEALVSERRSRR